MPRLPVALNDKPSEKKNVLLICLFSLGFVIVVWTLWTTPRYDLTAVEPKLRALTTPYQSVKCSYFTDGGSIGIEIVDWEGRKEQFALPARMGEPNRHTQVFVGEIYDRRPNATLVADSQATKQMLIQVLADYRNHTQDDDACLAILRRSPWDYARAFASKWRND